MRKVLQLNYLLWHILKVAVNMTGVSSPPPSATAHCCTIQHAIICQPTTSNVMHEKAFWVCYKRPLTNVIRPGYAFRTHSTAGIAAFQQIILHIWGQIGRWWFGETLSTDVVKKLHAATTQQAWSPKAYYYPIEEMLFWDSPPHIATTAKTLYLPEDYFVAKSINMIESRWF